MSSEKAYCLPPNLPDLQDGWEWKPLGELIASERGICYGIVQPGKHDENGVPMINSGDIFDTSPSINIQFKVSKILHSKFKRSTLKGGEILLTLVGANFGRVAIAPQSYAGYNCSRAIGVIPVVSDAEYIMYALQTPLARYFMDNWANTTAQPTFNLGDVTNLPIPWAPKNEREKIRLTLAGLDKKINLNRQTNQTLEQIAQALFKSWFVDFEPTRAKIAAKEAGASPEEIERAAMCAISGKTPDQLAQLPPEIQQNLKTTAALFPDALVDSELGEIPEGWRAITFGDFIERISPGKKFDQKTALSSGSVPILDQGKSGIIGFHNEPPSVRASFEMPVVVFANHTCYMRLITYDFSAIQNVLPFVGKGVDTVWAFYATKDKVKFSEYKGHWPDFVLSMSVVPVPELTHYFRNVVQPLITQIRTHELESEQLSLLRDALLPKLLSGEISITESLTDLQGAA